MKIKDLIKKSSFWITVAGALGLITQIFGARIDAPAINEIISGICAVLVLFGALNLKEKQQIENDLKTKDEDSKKVDEDKRE